MRCGLVVLTLCCEGARLEGGAGAERRDGGRPSEQPRRPRDHPQHPLPDSRARRQQGLHRSLHIALDILCGTVVV